jgi:hypothetical protein
MNAMLNVSGTHQHMWTGLSLNDVPANPSLVATQIPLDFSGTAFHLTVQSLFANFQYYYNTIFAIPSYVRQTLPRAEVLPPFPPFGAFPGGGT